jgi:non-homologous end joining protein Ku
MVEPRGAGMALITLRTADEVRPAEFGTSEAEIDLEAVAIARMIIERRAGHFDPATFRDRFQDAWRELVEAKMKGLPIQPRTVAAPNPLIDLMAALKRSLAQEISEPRSQDARPRAIADNEICYCRYRARAQKKTEAAVTETASRRRHKSDTGDGISTWHPGLSR